MNDFIKYLEAKNIAKTSQESYLKNVKKFLSWYKAEPPNCTKKDILKYLEYLKNRKKQQNRTRCTVLNSLNHYFTFLKQQQKIANNPTSLIKIRGTKKKMLYHIYTSKELNTIYDDYYHKNIRNFDVSNIPLSTRERSVLSRERNYIMLGLLIYQGLHTNELHKITVNDVDLNKATINIPKSRKTNSRKIALHASQIGALINYTTNIRPQFTEHYNSDALFLPLPENSKSSAHNEKLAGSLQVLTRQVKTLDKTFLNFKQIRASVITNWLKTEGLRKTQYLAGHRYISSTEKYFPNDLESLTDDIAKYNPF